MKNSAVAKRVECKYIYVCFDVSSVSFKTGLLQQSTALLEAHAQRLRLAGGLGHSHLFFSN